MKAAFQYGMEKGEGGYPTRIGKRGGASHIDQRKGADSLLIAI
jgi:hypothetical protein